MRRRSIPRLFRTALVFLASLQAARAGSVGAQSLGNHRVERATAASAPREPIPSLSEAAALALAVTPAFAVVEAPRAVVHAAATSAPRAQTAASPLASHDAVDADGWRPATYRGEGLLPRGSRVILTLSLPRGSHQPRAPCPLSSGN